MIDYVAVLEQLRAFDFTPIVLALLLGGAIGAERQFHGRAAGLRTHTLVCLCAAMMLSASRHVPDLTASSDTTIVFDPQRLAAGILTGIGFLGAGVIVRSGDIVRGVTTGASLWCVAGLGVVIGQGAYGIAVVMTGAALFVLIVLDWMPSSPVVYRRLRVWGETDSMEGIGDQVQPILRMHRLRTQEISGERKGGRGFELTFHIRCRGTTQAPRVLEDVALLDGVNHVDWTAPRR